MIICECGQSIEKHGYFPDTWERIGCNLNPETIQARYWARRMMKERDEAGILINELNVVVVKLAGERDALKTKLDAVIMKIESVCRGEYSGEDPYYILRNYLKSIKE